MANFVKRLNFKSDGHLIANEPIEATATNNRTHTLLHHNVMQENGIIVRTGMNNSGTQVTNFTVSENPAKPWETILTFASVGTYNVTYYSGGDINDSQDINNLYDTMIEKTSPLSRVYFTGNITNMTKDNPVNLSVRVRTKDRDINTYAKVSWQGSSSLNYPKKNFTLKFYTDSNFNQDNYINFQNWGATNKFVMKANYIDFTQSRNVISANIWSEMVMSRKNVPDELITAPSFGAIDGFPCELYVNDNYEGLFTFNLPKSADMAGASESNPNHAGVMIDNNWNLHNSPPAFRGVLTELNTADHAMEFPDDATPAITASYIRMFNFVRDSTPEQFKANIDSYLNKEALIDYYIFANVITGMDILGKNMMMYTFDGQKWCVTAYDLDSTWGLWWDGSQIISHTFHPIKYGMDNSNMWIKIANCFREELVARYKELRMTTLSTQNLYNKFRDFMNEFGASNYEKDVIRWTQIPSRNSANLRQLRENVVKRMNWMDETFNFESYDDSKVEALTSYTSDFPNIGDRAYLPLPWNDEAGCFMVFDGKVEPYDFRIDTRDYYFATLKMTSSNVSIESDATFNIGQNLRGYVFRYQDANNYIKLDVITGNFRLLKRVNGVDTVLGTTAYTTKASRNFKITCSGTSITVQINNTQVFNVTVPELVDNKLFGLVSSYTYAFADNPETRSQYHNYKINTL